MVVAHNFSLRDSQSGNRSGSFIPEILCVDFSSMLSLWFGIFSLFCGNFVTLCNDHGWFGQHGI